MKKLSLVFATLVASVAFTACNRGDTDTDIVIPAPKDRAVETISGKITTNTTWVESKKYSISGFVYVEAGATLTIEPGTIILGDKVTKGTLIVKPGGKLIARGTSQKPIVFTSSQAKGSRNYGDWGGIIMLGNAKVNRTGATIEGENISTFGGENSTDNSGVLKYVRIEFAGIAFETDKEINALTMGGVGSGTEIDYVQVSYSGDDAYEWFGGTVNAKHLISYKTLDDDFDTDWGYSGNVQYGFTLRDPNVADQCSCSDSNLFESDNDGSGSDASPQTSAKFANISGFISPGAVNTKYRSALRLRRNTAISVMNSVFVGDFNKGGLELEGSKTQKNFVDGKMNISGLIVAGITKGKAIVAGDEAMLNKTELKNQFNPDLTGLGLPANFNTPTGKPNMRLDAASKMLTSGATLPTGFDAVNYVGAFGTSDWTEGWTNFDPQNADY